MPGGPLLVLDGGAVGLAEVGWLQAAVGPPGDPLHEAGGEQRSRLHEKGAGQRHVGAVAGAGQRGVRSAQELSHGSVCDRGVWRS